MKINPIVWFTRFCLHPHQNPRACCAVNVRRQWKWHQIFPLMSYIKRVWMGGLASLYSFFMVQKKKMFMMIEKKKMLSHFVIYRAVVFIFWWAAVRKLIVPGASNGLRKFLFIQILRCNLSSGAANVTSFWETGQYSRLVHNGYVHLMLVVNKCVQQVGKARNGF